MSSIKGKTIVFTGTLSLLKRAEAKKQAEDAGAKVTAAVRYASAPLPLASRGPPAAISMYDENPGLSLVAVTRTSWSLVRALDLR